MGELLGMSFYPSRYIYTNLIFVDYMQQTGGQAHLFFWMTVEGYRVTAQQQLEVLQSRQKDGKHQTNQTKGLLRAAAFGIYEQYLSEKVTTYTFQNFVEFHYGKINYSSKLRVQIKLEG